MTVTYIDHNNSKQWLLQQNHIFHLDYNCIVQ